MRKLKTFGVLLKLTAKEWAKHNPLLIGAAISFYIILSMGPILAVTILILGEIFGKQSAQGEIVNEIRNIVGEKAAQIIQTIIQKASTSSFKTMAVISSIPLIFFGTTMVFFQLRNALNIIWQRKEEKSSLINKIKQYSFSFLMFLIVGFFFFLLVLKNPALSLLRDHLNNVLEIPIFIFDTINLLLSYLLVTLLFAAVYKILPKAEIKSKDIWIGSAVTSFFFSIVQVLVGINANNSNVDSSLGAIGSFTILFLWIFYSSLVFLFGACFTKVYSSGIIKTKKIPS